jgi:hypothetical protein
MDIDPPLLLHSLFILTFSLSLPRHFAHILTAHVVLTLPTCHHIHPFSSHTAFLSHFHFLSVHYNSLCPLRRSYQSSPSILTILSVDPNNQQYITPLWPLTHTKYNISRAPSPSFHTLSLLCLYPRPAPSLSQPVISLCHSVAQKGAS